MTKAKDLKRLVRARMSKTGESYTAARARLLQKRATAPSPAGIDYAALAGMADEKVRAKTGRTWEEWVRVLDGHDAMKMKHRDVAQLLHDQYGTPDWWTQTVTVGYERIKGKRAIGQRMDGTYEASKSRTFDVPVAKLYDAVAKPASRKKWLGDPALKPATATKPKYVRLKHEDGSIVIFGFTSRGPKKTVLSVQHSKLPSKEAASRLKAYWGERLDALEELLSG